MKNVLYITKKCWVTMLTLLGIRFKNRLELPNHQNNKSRRLPKEVVLDEYELNTYHS
ncbi:MAG TPA: hypothetical protein VFN30_03265 [Chitinophagaceae bacterium]|nr:hypothetical protein [Chitinophagaceae bacterium]